MFRVARALEQAAPGGPTHDRDRGRARSGRPSIGLEVHCELATATKLFCGCPNEFGAEPNTNVCPVCLGLPGSLPVLNEKAVEFALRVGEALAVHVPAQSIFHRKNYFYPGHAEELPDHAVRRADLPRRLDRWSTACASASRAHTSKRTPASRRTSAGGGRIHDADHSLVDYNRAGVPLLEIV